MTTQRGSLSSWPKAIGEERNLLQKKKNEAVRGLCLRERGERQPHS